MNIYIVQCVLFAFLLIINGLLYFSLSDFYQNLVLSCASMVTSLIFQTPVQLITVPYQNGFLLVSQPLDKPILFQFSLFSLLLGAGFLLPLIFCSGSFSLSSFTTRFITAFGCLLLLQGLQITVIVLSFLSQGPHFFISDVGLNWIHGPSGFLYSLTDQTALVLFPLIAVGCGRAVDQFFLSIECHPESNS